MTTLICRNKEDTDLVVQLDVFDEQKESDESQIDSNSSGIDLSSPLEVFDAILRQIADTPQEIPFVCILQHLLRIESKEAISDIIWDAAERLVHRATLLESADDASSLFKTQSHTKSVSKLKGSSSGDKYMCNCHQKFDRKESTSTTANVLIEDNNENVAPDESPLESVIKTAAPLPPPPMPPPLLTCPPPPPSLSNLNVNNGSASSVNHPKLPQQSIPTPSTKMRTVNWSKISSGQVLQGSQNNLWATYAKTHSNTPIALDWSTLEGLFCLPSDKSNVIQPNRLKQVSSQQNDSKLNLKRESNEVILLDAKRSLNINIFLKQFRRSNYDMIKLIENGYSEDFGSEKLRGLLKIFPTKDEIDMLKSVSDEDKIKLASAEKFLLELIQVENCHLRIEAMLLKEELDPCINIVEGSIHAILQAARDIKQSTELQEVIFMILVAGNFLNSGGYAGDAAGLKLSSLQKISDTRGNKPGISLLHFIAMQAEAKTPRLIGFVDELTTLDEASKTTTEQQKNEIRTLKAKIANINEQLRGPNIAQDIQSQFNQFVKNAITQVESLETSFDYIEQVRLEMAHFFCEEVSSFKLEDCFKILATFTNSWKMAANENMRRKILEKEGEVRKLLRETQMKKRPHQDDHQFKRRNLGDGSGDLLDEIIALSPRLAKRRVDVNGNTNSLHGSQDLVPSQEATPNGSLNRRRNRQHVFEHESGLMDFLRTSAADFSRERGGAADSAGSLDRSWYRNSRRRMNLPEFNDDRERPVSPSLRVGIGSDVVKLDGTSGRETSSTDQNSSWFVNLEQREIENDEPKKYLGNNPLRRLSTELSQSGLATLRENETSEDETKGRTSGRRGSLKLNTDILGAMGVIEAQGPEKDTALWRRPSLTFASEEGIQTADKNESVSRRSLIGSLAARPQHEKLVLYIPHKSTAPTRPKSLDRHRSTGEEDGPTKISKAVGDAFGTEEDFNRFASIRRFRKFRQPDQQLPKTSKQQAQSGVPSGSTANKSDKILETKLSNEAAATSRLKTIFSQGKQKPSASRPSLSRSASVDSNRKSLQKPLITSRGKMISPPIISEGDEGFDESQSSLSESNGRMDFSRPNRISTRRGGFREGREAVSTRSIVAAQRAAASMRQAPPSTKSINFTSRETKSSVHQDIGRTNSRSSLLSSRGQNNVRDKSQISTTSTGANNLSKPTKPPPPLPTLTRRSVSVMTNPVSANSRQNGVIRSVSKPEENNSDLRKLVAGGKPTIPNQQAGSRILSFMRPTAASTAKDRIELSAPSSSSKSEIAATMTASASSRAKRAFK